MAKQKTPTLDDFIDWCISSVKLDSLASLMTKYGYNRYDTETVIEAINASPDFLNEFGELVRSSLAEDKSHAELARAEGKLSASDWLTVAGGGLTALGTTISSILTGKSITASETANSSSVASQKASNAFLWIILIVVIIAIVAILWVSLSKKK